MEMQILKLQEEAVQQLPMLLSAVPTANHLLTACSLYCKELNINSEIDCFHSKSKTLGAVEHEFPKSGLALLVVMVSQLADSFNIGKNMSAAQVTDTALMILNDYPELKIDDVALCFTKAKKGFYGKVYDRLDSAIVFDWLNQFLADKDEQVEYFWQHQQLEIKKEGETLLLDAPKVVDDKVAISHIQAIKRKVTEIQKRNYAAKSIISKPVEQNLIQQVHNKWIKDFMDLWEAETWDMLEVPRGTRFITRYGKKLDVAEYLQIKHEQLSLLVIKINERWSDENMYPKYPK